MFIYPYETSLCADYALDAIVRSIRYAMADDRLPRASLPSGEGHPLVLTLTPQHPDVPPFAHPLLVSHQGTDYLVVDMRPFMRQDRTRTVTLASRNEYDLAYLRAVLTVFWRDNSPSDLQGLGHLPLIVFCRLLTENIVRRMGLDPMSYLKVLLVTGFYYLSLFRQDPVLEEQDRIRLAQQLSRALGIPAQDCLNVADQLDPMSTVKDYVAQLIKVVNSSRLEKFSAGLLYSIMFGIWFGANARETITVALEHPPTWIALVYTALTERTYKNTPLARTVQLNDKRDLGKQFVYNLSNLTKE